MSSYSKPHAWVENETVVHQADMDRIEDGLATHTHTSSEVTDLTTSIGAQVDVATINNAFGARQGQPISPWATETTIGTELWAVANFINGGAGYNTSTLTPSLVPNGTTQTNITRAKFSSTIGGYEAFRLAFDWTTPSNGWGAVSVKLVDDSGTLVAGSQEQTLVTNGSPGPDAGRYLFDFAIPAQSGSLNIEVKLKLENNANAGSNLAITNVSLKLIPVDSQRPMYLSKRYDAATYPYVYWQQRDVKTDTWKMAEMSFAPEGDLTPYSFNAIRAFYDDQPFATKIADPAMIQATVSNSAAPGDQFVASPPNTSLRVNNADQIHQVWNGTAFEYRGNTHNGEFTRSSPGASIQMDQGAGLVTYTPTNLLVPVRRVKVTIPSEFRRSVDGTTPYCSVDRTHTFFPDGMIRTDRTTTFSQTVQFQDCLDWMSSHDTTVPYVGRIGRGLTVLGETDSHPKVATPGTITPSTLTTGGTLAAATYSYRVSALSPYGESIPTVAVTQVTTGSTSTVTLTWSAVSNATGYRIYGRTAGVEKLLGSTTALTFTDTGANPPLGDPPLVNTANLYNGTSSGTMAQSSNATWAVYKDPRTGWCYGNIYDRESILSRTGVVAAHTRLMRGNGIQKNYTNVMFSSYPFTVTSGTVWTATHWTFTYLPADPAAYHNEIAVRAASIGALKNIYPIT